jgi:hypothetical protein
MGERVGELRGDCRANLPHALLMLPRERVAWTELEALDSDSCHPTPCIFILGPRELSCFMVHAISNSALA